jgi:hypothetical protein
MPRAAVHNVRDRFLPIHGEAVLRLAQRANHVRPGHAGREPRSISHFDLAGRCGATGEENDDETH